MKIGRVKDVTLNKTPKIQLEVEECTGVFRCDNLANGSVSIKKANILYMHDTCESKVNIGECNCLIILKVLLSIKASYPQIHTTLSPALNISIYLMDNTWH